MASKTCPVVLGIITARGGSKGLPGKNIRDLVGQPLISYSIQAAQAASSLDRVVVSTDDDEIAAVAKEWGAEIPCMRPAEFAGDEALVYPALSHMAHYLEAQDGYIPDYIMLLQPTSPLRTAEDIDQAIAIAAERNADGVVSLWQAKSHPYWAREIDDQGVVKELAHKDGRYSRRQALPNSYTVNGAIYMAKRNVLIEQETFYTPKTYAYIMPPERSLDIDSAWDFHLVELVLNDSRRAHQGMGED